MLFEIHYFVKTIQTIVSNHFDRTPADNCYKSMHGPRDISNLCHMWTKFKMFWYLFESEFPKDLLRKQNDSYRIKIHFTRECWRKENSSNDHGVFYSIWVDISNNNNFNLPSTRAMDFVIDISFQYKEKYSKNSWDASLEMCNVCVYMPFSLRLSLMCSRCGVLLCNQISLNSYW